MGERCAGRTGDGEEDGEELYSRLDQQFYLLCLDLGRLVERYVVNGYRKTNPVATYDGDNDKNAKPSWTFVPEQLWERRANLEGMVLRGLADDHPPFSVVELREELLDSDLDQDPVPDPTYDRVPDGGFGGPYGDALRFLEGALNFTTDLRVRKDGKWGIQDRSDHLNEIKTCKLKRYAIKSLCSDGNWDGMFGDLVSGEADILPTSFYMTPTRLSAATFLFPLGFDVMAVYVWTGPDNGLVLGTFMEPFRPDLWALLFVIGGVITFMAVMQRIYQKWRHLGRPPSLETLKFACSVLWVTLAVYFGKRLDKFPKETVWKGTLLGTLFVGNFVFISYRLDLLSWIRPSQKTGHT